MHIEIKLGKNFRALDVALRKAPAAIHKALKDGLAEALVGTAGQVKDKVGSSELLKRRTGHLAGAITYYPDQSNALIGYVGVGEAAGVAQYAWLLGKGQKTITPKRAQYLAIPVGGALTARGVPRYAGPRDVPGGFFFKKNENLLFGRKGAGGGVELLFVMKKSVTIDASGILPDVVQQQKPTIIRTIKATVLDTIKKLGIR